MKKKKEEEIKPKTCRKEVLSRRIYKWGKVAIRFNGGRVVVLMEEKKKK
jgi:hypothetical protein